LDPAALSGLLRLRLTGPGGSVKLFNEILTFCPEITCLVFRKSSLVTYSVLKRVFISFLGYLTVPPETTSVLYALKNVSKSIKNYSESKKLVNPDLL
jgi:hypothetical protein